MNGLHFPSLPVWLLPSALLRIRITYLWRHGCLPNLENPTKFTELVQCRKLHDRDPRMPVFADKQLAKDHVAQTLGSDWLIPTLWTGRQLPKKPDCSLPVIVKSTHGCNQHIICQSYDDWEKTLRQTAHWCVKPYGLWLDEWAYQDIEPGLIVEPYLGTAEEMPVDYKIYVFGGKATYVQVHLGRATDHRWMLFDLDWQRVSAPTADPDPEPPASLAKMIAAAETLADDFDFIRADFYEIAGQPLFGEMTFYPGSGLDPFDPPSLDQTIGTHWLMARNVQEAARTGSAIPPLEWAFE